MSPVWTKGQPIVLRKNCFFLRKGTTLELDIGSCLIPLDEPSKRLIKSTDAGKVFVWAFLLPDGSITEFFLHTHTYSHSRCKNSDKKILEDMRTYFDKPGK